MKEDIGKCFYWNKMIITKEALQQLLLSNGLINEKDLELTAQYMKNSSASFSEALIQQNIITDENLTKLIAAHLRLPFISLSRVAIPEPVFRLLPERLARKYKAIPFSRDENGIKLAMLDPTHKLIIELLAKKTKQIVTPYLCSEREINNALRIYRQDLQTVFNNLLGLAQNQTVKPNLVDAPVAKLVDLLIDYAAGEKASDIHIEAEEGKSLVRFRIDGVLHDILSFSHELHDRIASRIKVLAKLRTDEHLAPQDGKIRVAIEGQTVDIRVSIIPMVEGEKIVMRLLTSHLELFSFKDLGMSESDRAKLNAAINKSYGMILSTGPTGSGKTTTIYAILKILNTREKNITTIEDPVEYRIRGVNQIQVNPKTNLTFASGLRSILRQDPNIVFVGEIRDSETAGIAVNAALTGHLVLSTLHTNDAATALPRLTDMNIEPFLVASSVNLIIAQRLIRKICVNCRTSVMISEAELRKSLPEEIIRKHYIPTGPNREIRMYKGKGCKICHNTGYSGRVGIYEVLVISKQIKRLITERKDSDLITDMAKKEGMATMLDDGLQKVSQGITTLEEVLRVTKVESI